MQRILAAKSKSDSIGGTVACVIRNVPVGLGEPSFDKMEAKLAHAMLSIPATKGFEIGSGFRGTCIPGSKHNDPFVRKEDGSLGTLTNWSGGIQGGITNGEDIYFRYVFMLITDSQTASHLNHLLQFLKSKRRQVTTVNRQYSKTVGGTTHASCRVRCPLLSQWPPLSLWTCSWLKQDARLLPTKLIQQP